jgi:hypothetical protein
MHQDAEIATGCRKGNMMQRKQQDE